MESRPNSARFFCNRECEYYPCHEGGEELNCLFCYCPMYRYEDCLGSPQWLQTEKGQVKDCSGCTYPHRAEHYEAIMNFLTEKGGA